MEKPTWVHCGPKGRQVIRNGRIIYHAGSEADAEMVAGLIEAVAGEVVAEEREACAEIIHNHADRYTQWAGDPEDREKSARWQEFNALEEAVRTRGGYPLLSSPTSC